jgi:drug/metabolite transporter (DMT)-like permease
MTRNNRMAILIHVILCFVGFLFALLTDRTFLQNDHRQLLYVLYGLLLIIICCLYIGLGRGLLKHQGSKLRNLLSVSSVSIILLVLAILCSFVFSLHPTQNVGWALYLFANFSSGFLLSGQPDNVFLLLAFVFACIPSVCLWLGIKRK